ncbi:MAG: hypothetical protein NTW21_38440 [Verrucomicrobia bacterium]|nr:hypothetical protein [Verrucomicrobiota bacterium]
MHTLTVIPRLAAFCIASASAAAPLAPLVTADCQKLVSAADVDFTGLTPKPYHGMPIGTGEMGSLVWNSGSSALKFQINRTDVFGCNSAVTAVNGDVPNDEDVTKVVSDFGHGCGFVTVDILVLRERGCGVPPQAVVAPSRRNRNPRHPPRASKR